MLMVGDPGMDRCRIESSTRRNAHVGSALQSRPPGGQSPPGTGPMGHWIRVRTLPAVREKGFTSACVTVELKTARYCSLDKKCSKEPATNQRRG